MNTIHRYSRVFVAAALCALGSTGAYAQASWDLDACVTGGSCTGTGTSSTTTVSVSGFFAAGAGSNFATASLNTGTGWLGIKSGGGTESTAEPHHAIDNITGSGLGSPYEVVYLQFSKAVDLNNVASTGWLNPSGNADFQVWRWNDAGAPTLTSYTPTSMAASTAWTAVKAGDFEVSSSQGISDGVYYSSHWLITTAFGGSNDAFKLGLVGAAASVCPSSSTNGSGGCGPSAPVPEPTSIAMVLLAGIAATTVRRRRRA